MQFIDLETQYSYLKRRIDARIQNVLDHGQYIMGPEVFELEEKLADFVGVKHAITCANGTDALTLGLMALDINEGDAVFVPSFTFFASAEAIALARGTPIFVDSNETTFNMCPQDLERKILEVQKESKLKIKAVMPVDLFGLPANYPEISEIADKYGLKIIEDAAQGFGGEICLENDQIKKAGSFGDLATTSFFPAKPLGCYGDGGALFTDNDEYAELVRSYRIHGKGKNKYDNVRVGMNSRLDTIQAAILLEKLSHFPQELIYRNELADYYNFCLKSIIKTPVIQKGYKSSWAQYTLLADDENSREQLMKGLKKRGVPSVVYYSKCMHKQPAFINVKVYGEGCPKAENLALRVFSLPMHPYMKKDDKERVCSVLVEST